MRIMAIKSDKEISKFPNQYSPSSGSKDMSHAQLA